MTGQVRSTASPAVRRVAIVAVTAAISIGSLAIGPTSPASAVDSPAPDPCAGISPCVEGQSGDVTGDGIADRVAFSVRRAGDSMGNPRADMLIVVTSVNHAPFTYRYREQAMVNASLGTAPIDGVPGDEIAVLALAGANFGQVNVITLRGDRLVNEEGPWAVQGTVQRAQGVRRRAGANPTKPVVTTCQAELGVDPGTSRVKAEFTDYRWQSGAWVEKRTYRRTFVGGAELPRMCGGWDVPGAVMSPVQP